MKVSEIALGSFRIGKDLKIYELTKKGWKRSDKEFPNAFFVVKLFKANGKFNELIDSKDKKFLKGYSYNNEVKGARLNILPNGERLDKAYSLFSPELQIHDEKSHDHWDVMYKNPNGKYAYVYSLRKDKSSRKDKYEKVKQFGKLYPKLKKNVSLALNRHEYMALPMFTLLNTYIRVGNEIYYKLHKHKGLTTLMKKDVRINKDNVTFHYLGKDGVPINITKEFPEEYIKQLKSQINSINTNDFLFRNLNGSLLKEEDFKKAFKKYCGEEFYPHIVRSFIASKEARDFLKGRKSARKEEVKELFNSIASELGHKKFDKKDGTWKDSYNVTIHHYIEPSLVEKIERLVV